MADAKLNRSDLRAVAPRTAFVARSGLAGLPVGAHVPSCFRGSGKPRSV